ncbi:hypothetical protein SDC9_149442 [bioreactor metagenome]|uniref:Uncharacterized protein n=1 Tax=bioreactor metagenome TaxID=1076179 RepID=A0A645EJP1_9ZZZZ
MRERNVQQFDAQRGGDVVADQSCLKHCKARQIMRGERHAKHGTNGFCGNEFQREHPRLVAFHHCARDPRQLHPGADRLPDCKPARAGERILLADAADEVGCDHKIAGLNILFVVKRKIEKHVSFP